MENSKFQKLKKFELMQVYGGNIIGVLALGVCIMAFAYQMGKDFAKWIKKQEMSG